MRSRGVILRLIDVVLIILVGFIAITDRDPKARLDLPVSDPNAPEQAALNLLEIEVAANPEKLIVETRQPDISGGPIVVVNVPMWDYTLRWDEGEKQQLRKAANSTELETAIRDISSRFSTIKQVAIIPDDLSPVEGTIDVYDICQYLRLPLPAIDLSRGGKE
jgi:hypothetical protein